VVVHINLSEADLNSVDLSGANVGGADLSGAKLSRTGEYVCDGRSKTTHARGRDRRRDFVVR
jgi:hypothetical protein